MITDAELHDIFWPTSDMEVILSDGEPVAAVSLTPFRGHHRFERYNSHGTTYFLRYPVSGFHAGDYDGFHRALTGALGVLVFGDAR